jgi:hypothetical protein
MCISFSFLYDVQATFIFLSSLHDGPVKCNKFINKNVNKFCREYGLYFQQFTYDI